MSFKRDITFLHHLNVAVTEEYKLYKKWLFCPHTLLYQLSLSSVLLLSQFVIVFMSLSPLFVSNNCRHWLSAPCHWCHSIIGVACRCHHSVPRPSFLSCYDTLWSGCRCVYNLMSSLPVQSSAADQMESLQRTKKETDNLKKSVKMVNVTVV